MSRNARKGQARLLRVLRNGGYLRNGREANPLGRHEVSALMQLRAAAWLRYAQGLLKAHFHYWFAIA